MSFETLKWFWKFYLKNIFKTSHILFNIPCASFIVENYIFQKIFRRDIKLILIGGENEFSVLFKITYSILVFWIIQVILKGEEKNPIFQSSILFLGFLFWKTKAKKLFLPKLLSNCWFVIPSPICFDNFYNWLEIFNIFTLCENYFYGFKSYYLPFYIL